MKILNKTKLKSVLQEIEKYIQITTKYKAKNALNKLIIEAKQSKD